MNKVFLIGNLTKDHTIRNTEGGSMVLSNSVAVYRDKDSSDFINIVAFGKTAELIERYFAKGNKIGIEGSIRTTTYDSNGVKKYQTAVLVEKVEFLESKKETPKQEKQPSMFADVKNEFDISDDDLPF